MQHQGLSDSTHPFRKHTSAEREAPSLKARSRNLQAAQDHDPRRSGELNRTQIELGVQNSLSR